MIVHWMPMWKNELPITKPERLEARLLQQVVYSFTERSLVKNSGVSPGRSASAPGARALRQESRVRHLVSLSFRR